MSIYLGIELGSTRIKAVAIDSDGKLLAAGGHDWENRFENGVWTYYLDDVWQGLQKSFADLCANYHKKHEITLPEPSCIGISAMMHGYIALDKHDNQLAEFRTWRNTITEKSAGLLTEAFGFNIPQRWSIAHLHRAIMEKEAHVNDIAFLTTLAGYVHYKLTGEKLIGIGDASGMFPIDSESNDYSAEMAGKFENMVSEHKLPWQLLEILPKVQLAGEIAGFLTDEGAKLLDPAGRLSSGIPFCPPEGDAGTGMVATNAVIPNTGNISAGTSVFAMLVLEHSLSKLHTEIDMVTTPTGKPVAMVHCNNCTSDLDAWINLFDNVITLMGSKPDKNELYRMLYNAALRGDPDCGGLVSVNYLSGEHNTGFHEGRPLTLRTPDSKFSIENFVRSLIFASMATLRMGMDILTKEEGIALSKILGHGGLFKTETVGQKLMAGVLNIPISVMESAGEGGAWGIAVLAAYSGSKGAGETLESFLEKRIFADSDVMTIEPDLSDVSGFEAYLERYKAALLVERTAVDKLKNYE